LQTAVNLMNIDACLKSAVDGKAITEKQAREVRDQFERLKRHKKPGGEAIAGQAALDQMIADMKASAAEKRRQLKLSARHFARYKSEVLNHRNARGESAIEEGILAKLEHEGEANFDSVVYAQKSLLGQAHAKMSAMMMHFERGKIGGDLDRNNKADLKNVEDELFGVDTGDAKAKGLAKAWADTAEWLRQSFNAEGGAIGKLENWGLPQMHDVRALTARGQKAWKQDIRDLLDISRMKHPLSGRPILDHEVDEILDSIYDRVTTDGWIDRDVQRQQFGTGAVATHHAEHRFLVFKDPDSWRSYQKNYGQGDSFAAMMSHINMMTKDIAAMQILGPNPEATLHWSKNLIEKETKLKRGGHASLLGGKHETDFTQKVDTLWGSIRGELETPVNSKMAHYFAGARSLVTSVSLGSAVLSSVSDVGTSAVARAFVGIGAKGALPDIIKSFSKASREDAVASGLILDSAAHVFRTQARYVGTLNGPAWASYVADRVLALSGLTPWTQAARHAFGLAFMREAAVRVGQTFDQLDKPLRDTFGRYGFTATDWDLLRKAKLHSAHDGLMMLRANEIDAQVNPTLARRYLSMILAETEFAVPSGNHRAKVAIVNNNQPGTLMGEVIRSFAQFKSFGAVFALLHGKRIYHMAQRGDKYNAATYAAQLAISSFIMGSIAIQLKDIAAGREPRPMDNAAFAGAAFLQGGGFGIWGDFLFSDINRYGGTMGGNIGGPLLEKTSDFYNLTIGNLVQLGMGEKTQFGKELARTIGSNVPGNNIWYLRLAWERVLMANVQRALDPDADKAFRRQVKKREKDYGQGYWWTPGESRPNFAQ
jgi:hypothetical protein